MKKSITAIETRLEALEQSSPAEGETITIRHVSWDGPTWIETLTRAQYLAKYHQEPERFTVNWAPDPEPETGGVHG